MTENEAKAVRFIENIKNNAIVTLDHIAKEEPAVSPLVYKGREEKANTILVMVEELKQYRAIGTPEELQDMKNNYFEALSDWRQYRKIGTLEECRAAAEKQTAKRPRIIGNAMICPSCPKCFKSASPTYCPSCGQMIDWEDEE